MHHHSLGVEHRPRIHQVRKGLFRCCGHGEECRQSAPAERGGIHLELRWEHAESR